MPARLTSKSVGALVLLFTLAGEIVPADAAPYVLRAFLPNSILRQGEVRVVETPESVTIQTILYTRLPGRVIETICGKEGKSWPPGSACHPDAQAYCTDGIHHNAAGNQVIAEVVAAALRPLVGVEDGGT